MPRRPTRIPVRYALGAGIAAATLTTVLINLRDVQHLIGSLSIASAVILTVWLINDIKGREVAARQRDLALRLARQTELGVQQANQLRTIAQVLCDDGDTGPQPLRRVK